jgi:hypothetical protein
MNSESFIPGISPSEVISNIQASRQSDVSVKQKKVENVQSPARPKTIAIILDNPSENSYSSIQEFQLGGRIDIHG